MLHHVSFAVDRPREVAVILADLIGGKVTRFGPWPGGYIAWAADQAGTAIEIYPAGTELSPAGDGGAAHFARNYFAQPLTATHAALSVNRTEDQILETARRAGWQAARQDRGGFEVIEVWVENRVMLEVMTADMGTDYLTVIDAPRIGAAGTGFPELVLSAEVATDAHSAWTAWADAERLSDWWHVQAARIDLRIGGAYELLFLPPEGDNARGTEGCRILSYTPDRMLSFSWRNPPHLPGGQNQTWVVLTFTATPGGTTVELAHNGFGRDSHGDEALAYFRQAWRRVLRRMVEHWAAPAEADPASDLVAQPPMHPGGPG